MPPCLSPSGSIRYTKADGIPITKADGIPIPPVKLVCLQAGDYPPKSDRAASPHGSWVIPLVFFFFFFGPAGLFFFFFLEFTRPKGT